MGSYKGEKMIRKKSLEVLIVIIVNTSRVEQQLIIRLKERVITLYIHFSASGQFVLS